MNRQPVSVTDISQETAQRLADRWNAREREAAGLFAGDVAPKHNAESVAWAIRQQRVGAAVAIASSWWHRNRFRSRCREVLHPDDFAYLDERDRRCAGFSTARGAFSEGYWREVLRAIGDPMASDGLPPLIRPLWLPGHREYRARRSTAHLELAAHQSSCPGHRRGGCPECHRLALEVRKFYTVTGGTTAAAMEAC